ncbi:MAG TPA: lysylphosphatidylglycerol synthase transmembrane domain-containing protein [Polyangiaceae bacterium]
MAGAASDPVARPRLRVWRVALTLGVTLALVAVLVRDLGGTGPLIAAIRGARPAWVGVAFAASSTCVLLGVVRWQQVLRAMGYSLGFRRGLVVVLATWPLAVVTPSRANDLLRPLAVRSVVPLAAGTGSVVAEKAIDLFVLLAIAAVGTVVRGFWTWTAVIAAVMGLEVTTVTLVVMRRRWLARLPFLRGRAGSIEALFGAFVALGRAPARLASTAVVSLLIRLLTVVVTHALLVAVGAGVQWFDTLTLWPAAMLVGVVPLTLGGLGARDAAFLVLLGERGGSVGTAAVLAATMGYSAVSIWSFAIIGLPFMVRETLALRRP